MIKQHYCSALVKRKHENWIVQFEEDEVVGTGWSEFIIQIQWDMKSATICLQIDNVKKPKFLFVHFGTVDCTKSTHTSMRGNLPPNLPTTAKQFIKANIGFELGILRGVLKDDLPMIAVDRPFPLAKVRFYVKTDSPNLDRHIYGMLKCCFPRDTKIGISLFPVGIPLYCFSEVRESSKRSRMRKEVQKAKSDVIVLRIGPPPSPKRIYQKGQYEALDVGGNVHIFSFEWEPNPVQMNLLAFYARNWPLPSKIRNIFPSTPDGPYLPIQMNIDNVNYNRPVVIKSCE